MYQYLNVYKKTHMGIGSSLAATPSHTTGHTGPYPAIRLVKAETDKQAPVLPGI